MKKILSIFIACVLLFSLAACSGDNSNRQETSTLENTNDAETSNGESGATIDISKAKAQDYIDYFKKIGLFSDDKDHETWIQDHATYYPQTPVSECAGWWDNEGTEVCVMIFILDSSLADSSQEQYDEWMNEIKTNKTLVGEYAQAGTIDHLIGNIAFSYSTMTLDDDALAKVEAAYEQFVKDAGVTPEF